MFYPLKRSSLRSKLAVESAEGKVYMAVFCWGAVGLVARSEEMIRCFFAECVTFITQIIAAARTFEQLIINRCVIRVSRAT